MPAERLSMRKVREVLRLKHAHGMSYRKINEATGVGKTQAAEYVRRAAVAGITWPMPDEVDDAELERRLFPVVSDGADIRPAINWPANQTELKRRRAPHAFGMTRDAGAVVAGISRRVSGRVQLHAILRVAPGVEEDRLGDDAADPSGGREAVRRLGW